MTGSATATAINMQFKRRRRRRCCRSSSSRAEIMCAKHPREQQSEFIACKSALHAHTHTYRQRGACRERERGAAYTVVLALSPGSLVLLPTSLSCTHLAIAAAAVVAFGCCPRYSHCCRSRTASAFAASAAATELPLPSLPSLLSVPSVLSLPSLPSLL